MNCKRCDSEMLQRDGEDPTPYCDHCAHAISEVFDMLQEICEHEPVCLEIDTRSQTVEMYTKWPHDDPEGSGYVKVEGKSLNGVISEFHSVLLNK